MIVIGLTGSVGMGKSTTASLFAAEGVRVFDADATVHHLYGGRAVARIETAFPGVARDGVVDREALAARIIHDPAAMKRLEAIVHPLVEEERRMFLETAAADGAPMVVLDIPLLFETGGEAKVDVVVLASAPSAIQRERVLARPGMTEERFAAILARQMPDGEKRRRAHHIIETGEGLDVARRRVLDVMALLREADR